MCSTKKIVYAKHRPSAKNRAGYALFLNKGNVDIITFSDISIFVISLTISQVGIFFRYRNFCNVMKRRIGLLISVIVFLGMSPCNHFNGLTFVSSGESTIALTKSGEPYEVSLEYSLDGGVWQPYTIGETISLSDGENVMFRAGGVGNDRFSSTTGDYYYFKISGKLNAKGNVMSLLSRDCSADSVPEYAFAFLFWSCDGLMSAPMLPANTLSNQCYNSMFSGCKSLIEAPVLPATELAEGCYRYMFYNCTSLTKAPELSARKLARRCYYEMFSDCTSLMSAPELPAMKLVKECYSGMFAGCKSLIEAPVLPATELAEGCYEFMFTRCTNLIKAPELPATALAENCYYGMFLDCKSLKITPSLPAAKLTYACYSNMFNGCESLTEAPELPATELASFCYCSMFSSCKSLIEAPSLPATELAEGCYRYMFYNCTSLTKAPVLPARKLVEDCYYGMFCKCVKLNYVKAMFTDYLSAGTTRDWLAGVSYKGTFVKSYDAHWNMKECGIPKSWDLERN